MVVITFFLGSAGVICVWIVFNISGWHRLRIFLPECLFPKPKSDDNSESSSVNLIPRVVVRSKWKIIKWTARVVQRLEHLRVKVGTEAETLTPVTSLTEPAQLDGGTAQCAPDSHISERSRGDHSSSNIV